MLVCLPWTWIEEHTRHNEALECGLNHPVDITMQKSPSMLRAMFEEKYKSPPTNTTPAESWFKVFNKKDKAWLAHQCDDSDVLGALYTYIQRTAVGPDMIEVEANLAKNPDTPKRVLYDIAHNHPSLKIRLIAATNDSAPWELFIQVASKQGPPIVLPGIQAPDADLYGLYLRNADFREADFHSTTFDEVQASHASFEGTFLVGASFRYAQLQGVNFSGAVLVDTDFTGADLEGAIFTDAITIGAVFLAANLKDAVGLYEC